MLIVPEFCNKLKIEKIRETYKHAIFMCLCTYNFPYFYGFQCIWNYVVSRVKNLMILHIERGTKKAKAKLRISLFHKIICQQFWNWMHYSTQSRICYSLLYRSNFVRNSLGNNFVSSSELKMKACTDWPSYRYGFVHKNTHKPTQKINK